MAKKRPGAPLRSADHDLDRSKALKAHFDAAHEAGQKALEEHDYPGLARAIERERDVIKEQRARLDKRNPKRSKR